jgi:peptide subunit release factor 1 (eRF1)
MDLERLGNHIRRIAALPETSSPVISCYVNTEARRSDYRDVLDARLREIRKALAIGERLDFEQALAKIEVFLASEVRPDSRGVAIFSRAGESPFFEALQFRLPLPNVVSTDTVPHIYELVTLKDTYHRYVVLISTESHARIVEVSVGNVTRELWTQRPELRKRAGREWSKEQYQNHRRDRTHRFLKEKVEVLERLFEDEGHTHLVLAGSPRTVARIRDMLPRRLKDRLIDPVSLPGSASTEDVVNVTLAAFAEHEETESIEAAGLLLDELKTGGLAVAGTEPALEALARRQVDLLVMSEAYVPPPGWRCRECGALGVGAAPAACPRCGERAARESNLKEDMTRIAERTGATVEIVRNSDVLLEVGGVGCLLRYLLPEQYGAPGISRES